MFNRTLKLIAMLSLLTGIANGAENTKAIKVNVVTVKAQDIKEMLNLTGTTQPTQTARIASPSEGPVERCSANCYVREGDEVSKGQALLNIGNNKATKAQLSFAEQSFKEQEAELGRIKVLVEKGAIAASSLETTLSKYESAKANLIKAKEMLSDYSIKAPWNGIVSLVHVREGDYVVPRTPLVEIYDPSSIVISFSVPEQNSMRLNKNLDMSVMFDAYPKQVFKAQISRIYPQLDPKTHTRTVEAQIVGGIKLIPQMFTRVQVVIQKVQNALTVPSISIQKDKDNKPFVFIIKEDKISQQNITLGFESDGRVLVTEGISENDKVVTAGFKGLKNGVSVLVVTEKSNQSEEK